MIDCPMPIIMPIIHPDDVVTHKSTRRRRRTKKSHAYHNTYYYIMQFQPFALIELFLDTAYYLVLD